MVETLRAHGFTLLLLLNTLVVGLLVGAALCATFICRWAPEPASSSKVESARRLSDFPNPDETP